MTLLGIIVAATSVGCLVSCILERIPSTETKEMLE